MSEEHEIGQYIILDVNRQVYWTGSGWSKDRDKAEAFAYRYFAQQACQAFNNGIGMRVERK